MARPILFVLAVVVANSFSGQAEDGKVQTDKKRQGHGWLPFPVYQERQTPSRPSAARVARLPKSRPPEHATAIVQNGELIVERFRFSDAEREDIIRFEEDGEVIEERVIRFGTACHPEATTCDLSFVRAYMGDEELKADRLAALLDKPRHVLISPNGKNIDRFYREAFKDDCILLVLPDLSATIKKTAPNAPIGGNPPGEVQPDYPGVDYDDQANSR